MDVEKITYLRLWIVQQEEENSDDVYVYALNRASVYTCGQVSTYPEWREWEEWPPQIQTQVLKCYWTYGQAAARRQSVPVIKIKMDFIDPRGGILVYRRTHI